MSIYSSLNVGVTALQAQSNNIGLISQNLSNASTVGYKAGTTSFSDLIANGTATGYSPGGVMSSANQLNSSEGEINNTTSPTDIAIIGSGFFTVSDASTGGSQFYTRAGSFSPDLNGDYVNTAGYYLQGWPVDSTGIATQTLQTVNVIAITDPPTPTSSITIQANLDASQGIYAPGSPPYNATNDAANMTGGAIQPQLTRTSTITDSLGTSHTVTTAFLKTSSTTWAVEMYIQPASDVTSSADGQIVAGTVTLNSDGTVNSLSSSLTTPATISWADGATDSTTTFNSTLTSLLNPSQADYAPPYDATNPLANMASGSVIPAFNRPITVYDNAGMAHTLTMGFLKTGINTWAVEVYAQPASDAAGAPDGQVATGTVTFNGDGTLASVTGSIAQAIPVTWSSTTGGSNAITVNWGTAGQAFGTPGATVIGRSDGLSQFATPFDVTTLSQNGLAGGTLTSTSISADGFVQGIFSDGNRRDLFQIPLAEFVDPNQLSTLTGDIFSATQGSGTANYLQPGQSNAGKLQSGSLESSNVDVAAEMTSLIVAQQAYQANTKMVNTTDQMLQTLTQMVV